MNEIFNDTLINSIAWTLVHSIWQGVIISMLTGLVIMFTKRSTASLRYNLFSGLFVLFILSTIVTFILQLRQHAVDAPIIIPSETLTAATVSAIVTKTDIVTQITAWCNSNSFYIVSAWFLVFFIKSIRIALGLSFTRTMRRRELHEVGEAWTEKFNQLVSSLGLPKKISFHESGLVTIPMVIGFFKPVVLIPIGLLNNLTPEQAEAVLLHELAHIRRKDYLVNMLQQFAQAIFFFNPAVTWLSSLISDEREHCCDDIAIAHAGSKADYISALVASNEYAIETSRYALAFTGKKNILLNRVRYILDRNNKTLNGMEKILMLAGTVVVTSLILSFSPKKEISVQKKVFNDTIPEKEVIIDVKPAKKATVVKDIAIPVKTTTMVTPPRTTEVVVDVAAVTEIVSAIDAKPVVTTVTSAIPQIAIVADVAKTSTVSIQKNITVAEVATPVVEVVIDTIPEGASKEFIDGYNAGRNYQREIQNKNNNPNHKKNIELNKKRLIENRDMRQKIDSVHLNQLKQKMKMNRENVERNKKLMQLKQDIVSKKQWDDAALRSKSKFQQEQLNRKHQQVNALKLKQQIQNQRRKKLENEKQIQ